MKRLAIRVDGNRHIGLGHIFRCLHLASFLKGRGWEPVFLVLESSLDSGIRRFCDEVGVESLVVSADGEPWETDLSAFGEALVKGGFNAVMLDLIQPDPGDDDLNGNEEFHPANLRAHIVVAREAGLPVVAISDRFDVMDIDADVVVNTCPAQKDEWYAEQDNTYNLGPRYYFLPRSFLELCREPRIFREPNRHVVVFCGGNDHRGFTPVVLEALAGLGRNDSVEVLLGAATPDGEAKAEAYRKQGVACQYGIKDMAPVLFNADFVISASGNTLYDLAALGVPAAAVSTRERQRVTARYFAEQGSCLDLGMTFEEISNNIAQLLPEILGSTECLEKMSTDGRQTVDGNGLERMLAALNKIVEPGE